MVRKLKIDKDINANNNLQQLKQNNNIENSFTETLNNSDLHNVSAGLAETLVDSILNDGVLKELPIVSSIVGLGKTAISIKNGLFLKKIIHFLTEINHIPLSVRKAMIDYIDSREDQKIKVGEKLIFILDKCEDYIDTKYIAQFFCAFLEKKITYEEFLKGSRIIQNIFIGDLEYFLDSDITEFEKEASTEEAPDEDTFPLINIGICGFGYNPINIEDQWDRKMTNKYIVEGGETIIWVTSIGHKLKEILKKEK